MWFDWIILAIVNTLLMSKHMVKNVLISYITTTCGKRGGGLQEPLLQVEKPVDESLCHQWPQVVWGGTSSPSCQHPFKHDNCCSVFSLYIKGKKSSKEVGADGSHVTGLFMDGIVFFSMTTVKWAACWHGKRQRMTNTNQSSPLTCFHPLPKNAITGPYPGMPSSLL